MSQDNFDLFDAVPEVQTGFRQFGKLTISTKLMLWRDKKLEEANRTDFMAADKGSRAIDVRFVVDIQEFKPQLGFAYDRKVRVGGLDWQKTLVPSVESILGKGSMASDKQNTSIASLNGKYVSVIDVPEQPTKKQKEDPTAKVYSTVKFIKVYASREECLHDASEGFAGTASNGSAPSEASDPNVPSGWGANDWRTMKDDPSQGVATMVSKALKDAEAATKGKPKPVQAKAMEEAKNAAIANFVKNMECTVEQATALLNS